MEKKDIFGLSIETLQALLVTYGFKKFRAKQVFEWIYKKSVFEFSKMKNISKDDIQLLEENFLILPACVKILKEQISSDKLTRKVLIELPDGNSIETVCMSHDYGYSVCVSSQVGCNMGCAFCASGLTGFVRNLTQAEILLQVYYFNQLLAPANGYVSRVVVMGAGEPMLNFDAVLGALEFLHMETASNMSYRNMTISTCGIIPGIEKLIDKKLPINLAISLHSAKDDIRSELMPINKNYPLLEVIKAADGYAKATGRQVTYEYILIENKNDSALDAELLSNALRFKNASVNLIPANPVEEKGFKRPSPNTVERFLHVLKKNKINATVRREMGKDIDAACGQLRSKFIGKKS